MPKPTITASIIATLRTGSRLELLKEGQFRAKAHHLGLEQELPADACVDIFFLADLKPIWSDMGTAGTGP